MIAVIVPAHNEAQRIGRCLASVQRAARHPSLAGETVMIIVVADDCSDATETIAREAGAVTICMSVRDASVARTAGADMAVWAGARWLAFVNAHAVVAEDWLAAQLAEQADVVCGRTVLHDAAATATATAATAATAIAATAAKPSAGGGIRVHAGNFGVRTATYCKSAGFASCVDDDDLALGRALAATGALIVRCDVVSATAAGLGAYRTRVDRSANDGFAGSPPQAQAQAQARAA
ncbi:MAG: glycosyltransferase [Burkholderiaceae bacterium]